MNINKNMSFLIKIQHLVFILVFILAHIPFCIFAKKLPQNNNITLQSLTNKNLSLLALQGQKISKNNINPIPKTSKITEYIPQNTAIIIKGELDDDYMILNEKNRKNNAIQLTQKFTISGFIREKGSGELLPGVNVYLPEHKVGTSTNSYGFYSITFPESKNVKISITSIGYQTDTLTIHLIKNIEEDFFLQSTNTLLEEIVVKKKDGELSSENPQMSVLNTPISQMQNVPALLGEKDMLKVLQLMPGVHKGAEGSSGLYVRGGGPDQNLIILDDAPVYNAFHLFGFFSLFNGDALKSVELTKGGFPARFGGRLSSIIEMKMKEGNKEALHGDVSLGLISAKATIEGPIQRGKSSFLLSGRRTYFDLLFNPNSQNSTTNFYFYDFNAKMNFDINRKNKLYISSYFGKDDGKLGGINNNEVSGLYWRNATATLRWNHLFSEKVFLNSALIFSDYLYKVYDSKLDLNKQNYELSYGSSINDLGVKMDLDWLPNPNQTFKMGLIATAHRFTPSSIILVDNTTNTNLNQSQEIPTTEAGIYVEDQVKIFQHLRLNIGLRETFFRTDNTNYINTEPRLSIAYTLPNHWALKASYALMNQYIHLLSNSGEGLPTDLWVPATNKLSPERSEQVAIGFTKDIIESSINISLESYYKKMNNIIAYKSSTNSLLIDGPAGLVKDNQKNLSWEANATSGQGWAYGTEFLIQKKVGRFKGWLGYTLSWTENQFDELNFGQKFFAKYDRRHDASVVGIYELTPKITLSGTWTYSTGNVFTLPLSSYQASIPAILPYDKNVTYNVVGFGNRNNFRAEAYHRLDVNIQFYKKNKKLERFWDIGIYNLYNHYNPFFYRTETTYDISGNLVNSLKKVALFPLIPSVSFRLKF